VHANGTFDKKIDFSERLKNKVVSGEDNGGG